MGRALMDQFLDQAGVQEEEGYKNDPPGNPTGPYGHGEGGLFYNPGASNKVFSTLITPASTAADVIPVYSRDPAYDDSSNMFGGEMEALDTLLTGVTKGALDEFENQPTEDCADGPVGGLTKLCTQVNPFARFRQGVREISMVRAGQAKNLADTRTIQLMNSPVMTEFLGKPSTTPNTRNAMANEFSRRLWESTISFRRMFVPRVWIGSPANNVGERRDLVGLDIHINEGNKIDAKTSAICTAANSTVFDFGYEKVTSTVRSISEFIEYADYLAVEQIGGQSGLGDIDGWIFMRPEIWRSISSSWPVQKYVESLREMMSYTGGSLNLNASDARLERESLRRSRRLPVNSRSYQVVVDDSMPFETNLQNAALSPGQYASDIVFVPRTVLGGVPVTFFEVFNHNNDQEDTIQRLAGGNLTFTTDGGRYRHYVNFKNGCLSTTWEFSPRLKVKTPHVGWRIQNVVAEPLRMPRSWDPDSSYFTNGGGTSTPADTFYTPWSTSTPVSL